MGGVEWDSVSRRQRNDLMALGDMDITKTVI